MRRGEIWLDNHLTGILTEDENGYHFAYDEAYVLQEYATAISLTLPLQKTPSFSPYLFPFFDGLIPEGWLLDVVQKNWKINPNDRMGLLLFTCRDCIGNICVRSI